jgi:N2-citryl-N6-acetyl-N6-hydroxylysine synthase
MKNAKLALHHSTASFLNSFFRDHQKDTTRVLDRFENQKFQCLKIKLTNDEHLIVPLKSFSATGKHQYTDFFFHETKDQSTKINFVQLLNLLVTPNQQVFLNRFHNSRENIELILSERNEELKNLEISDLNFLKSEQALYLGHPFHPHPKSKDEFSSHDLSLYSPELKGSFQLHWFFVSNEYLEVKVAPNHHFNQQNIYLHDLEDLTKKIPSGFTAMPIHPWQKQHLLKNSEIKKLIEQNKIIDAGPGKKTLVCNFLTTLDLPPNFSLYDEVFS